MKVMKMKMKMEMMTMRKMTNNLNESDFEKKNLNPSNTLYMLIYTNRYIFNQYKKKFTVECSSLLDISRLESLYYVLRGLVLKSLLELFYIFQICTLREYTNIIIRL